MNIGKVVGLLLCAITLASCAHLPPTPRSAVRLYAMDCGRMTFADGDPMSDDGRFSGRTLELPLPCFLIRHPSGDMIWDTGPAEAIAKLPAGLTIAGARTVVRRTISDQLAELGLTPQSITYVSISHSHRDHASNVGLFTNATWLIDPKEQGWMHRSGGVPDQKKALATMKVKVIDTDPYDVFGDGSVKIIRAPGHTPGHTVLLVQLPHSGAILLAGDLWQTNESRRDRLVPRINVDRTETLASMQKVEAVIAASHARVVRQHVMEDFLALPAFPRPLE